MSETFIEYQEVAGKVVDRVRFYNNPPTVPEVLIRFTDGTSLSLKINLHLKVEGEYYRDIQGEIETLGRYDPLVAE